MIDVQPKFEVPKVYLGDSVYAQFDGYHIILTTENGWPDDPRNRIALEPPVLEALNQYQKSIEERWKRYTKMSLNQEKRGDGIKVDE